MGIFNRVKKSNSSKQYDGNVGVLKFYSTRQECVNDILESYKKEDKTSDISSLILQKYSKENKQNIQDEILKKYFKLRQDEINHQENMEQEEINQEVDETLEGESKETKEKVKKELSEEKEQDKDESNSKDKKQELKGRIYKAAYKNMYKDYTKKVLDVKNEQYNKMTIAVSTKEAVEILAYEKNLEKLEIMYNKSSSKKLSQNKEISKKREEFKDNFEYNQKGINNNTDKRVEMINRLYIIREAKYREYIDALADKSKSPQELALYKRDYEDANLNLIQNVPSLAEYSKDLEAQDKNIRIAKEEGLDEISSAVNNRLDTKDISDKEHNMESVQESEMAQNIDRIQQKEYRRDTLSTEYSKNVLESQMNKENLGVSERIVDAQEIKEASDNNINNIDKKQTRVEVKENIQKETNTQKQDFLDSIRSNTNVDLNSKDVSEISQIANDDLQKNYEDGLRKRAEDVQKNQRHEENEQRVRRKPKNGNK